MSSKTLISDESAPPYPLSLKKSTHREPGAHTRSEVDLIFHSMLERLPDIVLRIDAEGRLLYGNPRSEAILGAHPSMLIGKSFEELGLPESMCQFWKNLIASALDCRMTIQREFFLQTPEMTRRYEARIIPEAPDCHEIPTLLSTVREVSRRQGNENEFMEAGQRLIYHMNNSPLAVFEFDIAGNCLAWNHKAEEFFGPVERAFSSTLKHCLPLVYPEDQCQFEEVHERVRSGRQMSAMTCARFIHRNNTVRNGEWYLSGLLNDDGRCHSILCFLHDVTEREECARQFQQSKKDLEEKIIERTMILSQTHENLLKESATRKHLELELVKVSEREHRRLGHDLHDGICQELAGIHFSIAALLKKVKKNSASYGPMQSIVMAIRRAIQQVRLLARGLAPIELQNGDLQAALEELAHDTAAMFQIECVVDQNAKPLELDYETTMNLYRIAQESVQNAIKHGEATRIRISLDCQKPDGLLTITDNGIGIDSGTPSKGEGNGMGLTIMRHRAALIGGQVKVASHNGSGTVVNCTFRQ